MLHDNQQVNVNNAIVDADRNFGLLGRDILNKCKESIERCFRAEVSEKLPTVKCAKVSSILKPDAKPMFCAGTEGTVAT